MTDILAEIEQQLSHYMKIISYVQDDENLKQYYKKEEQNRKQQRNEDRMAKLEEEKE